ncbi:hypothetical protein B0T10DRAFT_547238 [Thelonectria olida]|uniref:Uncharacterized protein n=1 Tax=Thelonectria olida TaxID=1576542 RepID=A0A9P8WAM7_9HYPO|nr:hypothetical protein B0T10DRAFT_547238 [Thelonectria olida]
MADEKINLQRLRDEGQATEEGEKFVTIFESAFEVISEETLEDETKRVVSELQKLVSPELPAKYKDDLFDDIWEALIGIARHVHYRHLGQSLLLNVFKELNLAEPWRNLPNLGQCMRDNWIDPTFEPVEGEDETYSPSEWLNLNSFAARLFGAGIVGWVNFPIWQLRHGLEEDASPGPDTDCRVAAASEWLIQAGPNLLRRCLLRTNFNEAQKRSYRAGAIYSGHAGLNLERWGFWKRRLGEVQSVVDEEAAASVDEAVKTMTMAAAALAN